MEAMKTYKLILITFCFMSIAAYAETNTKVIHIQKGKPDNGRGLLPPTWAQRFQVQDSQTQEMKEEADKWARAEEKEENWGKQSAYLKNKDIPTEEKEKSFAVRGALKITEKSLLKKDEDLMDNQELAPKSSSSNKTAQNSSSKSEGKNETFNAKIKTKPTSGRASLEIDSFVINSAINVNAIKNEANVHAYKRFKNIGLQTGSRYELKSKKYETYIDKNLTDSVVGRISSTSNNYQKAVDKSSDQKVEVIFAQSF